MARSSRSDHQPNLPPMLLANDARSGASRTNCADDPQVVAAQLFDEALTDAQITSKWVAGELKIDESLVNKWRSAHYRESPSWTQTARLPFSFHLAHHKAMNRHFGFGRAALLDLLDAAGRLAVNL